MLRPEITRDERFLKNLKRECRALAKLLHPTLSAFEMAYGEEQIAIVLGSWRGGIWRPCSRKASAGGERPADLGQGLEGLSYAHQQSMIAGTSSPPTSS